MAYQARPGSGFLFCPDQVWTAHAISQVWRYETLYISERKLRILIEELKLATGQRIPRGGAYGLDSRTSDVTRQVLAVFQTKSSLLERIGALIEFAATVDSGPWPGETTELEPRVAQIRNLLREKFTKHVQVPQLARLTSLTPSHFTRVFNRTVGVPPHSYVTLVRVRHAENLLRSGVPIVEVADRAGFCDQSHLNRCFRRLLGFTPGQYLKVNFFRVRPAITEERVKAYRLRSGEKLWRYWVKLRAARGLLAQASLLAKK
jgi:AraC-like DNA-binding protein